MNEAARGSLVDLVFEDVALDGPGDRNRVGLTFPR
jgi:hypothetical protein